MEFKDYLSALSTTATFAAFTAALLQYRKGQRWKAAEFLAQQMKELDANPGVQLVKRHLDIQGGTLGYQDFEGMSQVATLDHAALAKGLHVAPPGKPSVIDAQDAAIRAMFDAFFEGTERLGSYVETGLIRSRDIRPYLGYYFTILTDERSPELVQAVREFLGAFSYVQTQRLLDDFRRGKDPARK